MEEVDCEFSLVQIDQFSGKLGTHFMEPKIMVLSYFIHMHSKTPRDNLMISADTSLYVT